MAVYPMDFDIPHRGLEWLEYYSGHKVYHPGWDLNKGIGNQDLGHDVFAPVDGMVEYVGPLHKDNGGFGNFIILYHPAYGVWSRYAHLKDVKVLKGDRVKTGQVIGTVGNTGTKYAHLHFEVFNDKCYQLQTKHWRKYGMYPSGKSKTWVQDHYLDGLAWIDQINKEEKSNATVSDWAKPHLLKLQNLPHRVTNGERPRDPVTREEVWTMLGRLLDNFNQQ